MVGQINGQFVIFMPFQPINNRVGVLSSVVKKEPEGGNSNHYWLMMGVDPLRQLVINNYSHQDSDTPVAEDLTCIVRLLHYMIHRQTINAFSIQLLHMAT